MKTNKAICLLTVLFLQLFHFGQIKCEGPDEKPAIQRFLLTKGTLLEVVGTAKKLGKKILAEKIEQDPNNTLDYIDLLLKTLEKKDPKNPIINRLYEDTFPIILYDYKPQFDTNNHNKKIKLIRLFLTLKKINLLRETFASLPKEDVYRKTDLFRQDLILLIQRAEKQSKECNIFKTPSEIQDYLNHLNPQAGSLETFFTLIGILTCASVSVGFISLMLALLLS